MTGTSLIAGVHSSREAWTGVGLADSIEGVVDAVRSEGWVDDVLAGAGLALEVGSAVLDPFSALLSSGLSWAMEYFEPLRQILDELTGMPDVVASHAATWNNIADELSTIAADLQTQLAADLPDWTGAAAETYQALMTNNIDGIGGLGAVSAAIGAATQAAGNLVGVTRDLVRELIADLVARVIVWAVEAIFVVTIPVVAAQIASAVVKWAGRIMTYVVSLLSSLRNLTRLVRG
jgi:uncharacterized protein YukE